jgi:hypothetical protein
MVRATKYGEETGVCEEKKTRGRTIAVGGVLCLALLFLSLCVNVPGARAQLYTGSVTGVVTDPSGAVVVGAQVTLVDAAKGYTFKGETGSAGRYVLRSIPPGDYTLLIEAKGFQTYQQKGIRVDVDQNISVDAAVTVGAATETIEVNANAVQLQTEDAVTGQVVNRRFVNDLPLVDRNFTNLTYLAPGVTETDAPGSQNSQGGINFNSNGSRNATADVLIDGASVSNFDQNSGIQNVPYTPSVDSVEEFKVEQSNFSAEYGFAVGAIINVITRSGTNQLHGSAYEFFRNSVMDANDWFANASGEPIAALKRNNFGATLGGPIRKDKTFFFVDYEGVRESTSASSGTMGVPSLCERGDPSAVCPVGAPALGNFSELCTLQDGTFDANGLCSNPAGRLYDPYTGTFGNSDFGPGAVRQNFIPFNNMATYISPGNALLAGTPFQPAPGVPGNLIDPLAAKLLLLFPKPTVNATDFGTLQNANFFSAGTNSDSNNQFDIKIDHRFSERDLLSGRYSQQYASSTSFNCFGSFVDPCTGGPGTTHRYVLALNNTYTFSPTVALTLTFGYLRGFDDFPGIRGEFPNIDQSFTETGFPAYLNNGFGTIPDITIGGYSSGSGGANLGTAPFSITREGQNAYDTSGSVSWLKGRHEFKFGGEWRIRQINHGNPGWPSGLFAFDYTGTAQIAAAPDPSTGGGDGMASFLTGVGSPTFGGGGCTPCQQGFNNFVSTTSFQYGAFAQDNFRVTPKLTLNLGLRYELNVPRTERYNRMNWLDPATVSPLQVPGLDTLHGIEVFTGPGNRQNYYTDYKDVQPRIGFAYQIHPSWVIRGGYGIYYSTTRSGAAGTGPWGYQGYNIQPPWLTTLNIDHATPWNTLKDTSCLFTAPFTCSVAPPPGNSLGAFNDIGADAVGPIKKISQNTPYEQAWSLGFQKELPGKVLLDAAYVGKKGTHLYLGAFRNTNLLPASAIAGLTPSEIGDLTNLVPNPFYFDPTLFPAGTACDATRYICNPATSLGGPQIPQYQLLLPYPQYTSFSGDSPPIANSIYNALQVRIEKQMSHGLQLLMTYAYSKSIDDASSTDDSVVFLGGGILDTGNSLNVQNPYDLRAERAASTFDITHVWQLSYIYEIPIGRGRALGTNMNPILDAIVGGWQTNGIVRLDSGRPILPLLLNSNPIPTFGQRPNLTAPLLRSVWSPGQVAVTNGDQALNYFANPDALSQTDNFALGTAPRTISSVRQPGARDFSMSLFKEFSLARIHEGMRLQFRAESFNTFNHPHFQGPDTNVGSSTFGEISSTVNHPRELQMALKLYF